MENERKILELWDNGEGFSDWSWWKKNYIRNMYAVSRGNDTLNAKAHYESAVVYIREPDSAVLSPALSVHDKKLPTKLDALPEDTRRVCFTKHGHLSSDGSEHFPSFSYSPAGGYEVPPPHLLGMPLTLDDIEDYQEYYIDGEGFKALRSADFGGYQLVDKRSMYGGKYDDAWAITRGPQESREVLMVDGTWLPVDSEAVHWNFINDYPKFSYPLKQAIKLIESFD